MLLMSWKLGNDLPVRVVIVQSYNVKLRACCLYFWTCCNTWFYVDFCECIALGRAYCEALGRAYYEVPLHNISGCHDTMYNSALASVLCAERTIHLRLSPATPRYY